MCATADEFRASFLASPPPPKPASGCAVPNTTGVHASVFGRWYRVYGSGYTGQGGAAAVYSTAVTTCSATAGGRLATFKNQYQQWLVESILFPNITAGAIDSYWVSNVQKGLQHSTTLDNTTWYWTDTHQLIGALPSANETRLYSRWGANEPQLGQAWRCAIATRGLAYDTLGPWPQLERQFGNMSVWGWTISNCNTARPYICELPCEQQHLRVLWHSVTQCWSGASKSKTGVVSCVHAMHRHLPGSTICHNGNASINMHALRHHISCSSAPESSLPGGHYILTPCRYTCQHTQPGQSHPCGPG